MRELGKFTDNASEANDPTVAPPSTPMQPEPSVNSPPVPTSIVGAAAQRYWRSGTRLKVRYERAPDGTVGPAIMVDSLHNVECAPLRNEAGIFCAPISRQVTNMVPLTIAELETGFAQVKARVLRSEDGAQFGLKFNEVHTGYEDLGLGLWHEGAHAKLLRHQEGDLVSYQPASWIDIVYTDPGCTTLGAMKDALWHKQSRSLDAAWFIRTKHIAPTPAYQVKEGRCEPLANEQAVVLVAPSAVTIPRATLQRQGGRLQAANDTFVADAVHWYDTQLKRWCSRHGDFGNRCVVDFKNLPREHQAEPYYIDGACTQRAVVHGRAYESYQEGDRIAVRVDYRWELRLLGPLQPLYYLSGSRCTSTSSQGFGYAVPAPAMVPLEFTIHDPFAGPIRS